MVEITTKGGVAAEWWRLSNLIGGSRGLWRAFWSGWVVPPGDEEVRRGELKWTQSRCTLTYLWRKENGRLCVVTYRLLFCEQFSSSGTARRSHMGGFIPSS